MLPKNFALPVDLKDFFFFDFILFVTNLSVTPTPQKIVGSYLS